MEIQHVRPDLPSGSPFLHWGVRGGAVVSIIPLGFAVVAGSSTPVALIVLVCGAVLGGMASVIAALVSRRRQGAFESVERELRRARGLMEDRLIDEEDYQRLKNRIVEGYRPGSLPAPRLWSAALWGAWLGVALPGLVVSLAGNGLIPYALIAAGAGIGGGLLTGGAAAVLPRLGALSHRLHLPAPKSRRLPDR